MMIIEKESHRESLLQLFHASTIKGDQIEVAFELYSEIKSAIVRNRGERQSSGNDAGRSESTGGD